MQWRLWALAVILAACGKAPSAAPSTETLRGFLVAPEGLSASRLRDAGCIAVVDLDGHSEARFTPTPCSEIQTPPNNAVFSLEWEERGTGSVLRKDGTLVGQAGAWQPAVVGEIPRAPLLHLCQLSDPQVDRNAVFSQLCQLSFTPEGGFASLQLATLEELALRKNELAEELEFFKTDSENRVRVLEETRERLNQQRDDLNVKLERARDDLVEARNGISRTRKAEGTIERFSNLTRTETELELAIANRRYIEASIQVAEAEGRKADLLKERIEISDQGLARVNELKSLDDYLANTVRVPPDSRERQALQRAILLMNKLVLSKEERENLDKEKAFAGGEAQRLDKLRGEELPQASIDIRELKDKVNSLRQRLPGVDIMP